MLISIMCEQQNSLNMNTLLSSSSFHYFYFLNDRNPLKELNESTDPGASNLIHLAIISYLIHCKGFQSTFMVWSRIINS